MNDSEAKSIADQVYEQARARVGSDKKLMEIELNRLLRADERVFAAFRQLGLLSLESSLAVKH